MNIFGICTYETSCGWYAEPFDNDENYYTVTCVKEKVHKMTLADIEKELGYKIELKEN